jgi:tetratricopeptide (TPR) repeat protein
VDHYRQALKLAPTAATRNSLGLALALRGDWSEALEQFRRAMAAAPEVGAYFFDLARAYQEREREPEARQAYADGLRRAPEWAEWANAATWRLATDRDPGRRAGALAVYRARQLCEATGHANADYLDTLAAAYAEVGRFNDAVETEQRALSKLKSADQAARSAAMHRRLRSYEEHQPYRQSADQEGKWPSVPEAMNSGRS